MTPVVRPVLSVYAEGAMLFAAAEIPPLDLAERPCFKTARGRLKGSFIRVGDADKPMTEYEVYSCEAYRKRSRDDLRPVERISSSALDQVQLERYLLKRKLDRPNFVSVPAEQLYELTGLQKEGQFTLTAVLLFSLYPQAYFPQLSIIAFRVPGAEMGEVDETGRRFLDSKRIEGSLVEMLEGAVSGGLYGRLTVDQLGKAQPDTRNPAVITVMEALGQTENRYSGIPRIRRAMAEAGLPEPVFRDDRWEFSVRLYNKEAAERLSKNKPAPPSEKLSLDDHGLLDFCGTPRTRKEIVRFLGIASGQYALRRYLEPLVKSGMILLALPDRPKSPKQTYRTNPDIRR